MVHFSFASFETCVPGSLSDVEGAAPRRGRTIGVLGGGISGLACAVRLAQEGHVVTLIEGADQLGGLGAPCVHQGRPFEKFYHCLLPSDGPLLQLLDEAGLAQEIYWKPTTFAYASRGKIYPLNTVMDLLRFRPLNWMDRLRVGLTGLYGRMVSAKGLDEITAASWLRRLSGRKAFATFWQPMLEAKFGDCFDKVPALWFWSRFNREKGDRKGEVKGYLRGGYRRIAETLGRQIQSLGGTIRLQEKVVSLDLGQDGRPRVVISGGGPDLVFDQLVITTPWPGFDKMVGPSLKSVLPKLDHTIDYQGVINCLLFLRRPLTRHYWVATPESGCPFDGVVETSTLTGEPDRGSRHVVYLTKYLHREDPRFAESEDVLRDRWWQGLKKLFPDLRDSDLEDSRVFRSPFVEPIYTTGYEDKRPPEVLVPGRVYLSSTVQVYPTVTSWNGCVAQAERTLEAVRRERYSAQVEAG